MNILQVQDALKNASDQQLAGELQNPTGMAPSYLVLSELKRRQQMRQGAQAAQAPQGSMAEEAAGAAEPEYYPEEQQQEEVPGIEAFREGGVVRMQAGGSLDGYAPENFGPGPEDYVPPRQRLFDPFRRLREFREETRRAQAARERGDIIVPPIPDYTVPGAPSAEPFTEYRPTSPAARPSGQPTAPTEGQMPATVVTAPAPSPGQPATPPSPTRAGAGIGAVAAQPASQQEEGISSLYGRLRELSPSREEYRRDAVNNALMQAGLAMMASKDPNALANLGAGGLRGLQAYTEEMRAGRAQQRQAIADEITARRANTEELYRRGLISNQERQLRLMEARAGQAAGERAEARSEAAANRRLQIEAMEAANMRSMLPTIRSRIADINKELTSPMASLSVEEKATLRTELEGLLNNERQIRAWLMSRQGLQGNTPAQTENPNTPPPGAPIIPYRAPGVR